MKMIWFHIFCVSATFLVVLHLQQKHVENVTLRDTVHDRGVRLQTGKVDTNISEITIAIGTLSIPSTSLRRSHIRKTYASESDQFVHRFCIGTRDLSGEKLSNLVKENEKYADLILQDSVKDAKKYTVSGWDRFELTKKVLYWFKLAIRMYPSALFIGKTDIDTFLVWPNLLRELKIAFSQCA